MRRHGVAAKSVHFGLAVWPYDILLRFGYDLPEHDYLWEGQWFDDRFESAALDIRATTSKLLLGLQRMDAACERLAAVTDAPLDALRVAAEEAPLDVESAADCLRRLLVDLATVVPCCFGGQGRVMLYDRDSLIALAGSPALRKLDGILADLLHPPEAVQVVLEPGWATHLPELYTVAGAAGDQPPLPGAASSALRASVMATLDAAHDIDAALVAACPWLDAVVDHLQAVVAARAEDGPELLKRWAEVDWPLIPTRVPLAVLARHLPAI